jgi:hypothetical protein
MRRPLCFYLKVWYRIFQTHSNTHSGVPMKRVLILLGLLFTASAPARATEIIKISDDRGGLINYYLLKYTKLSDRDVEVQIDGPCYSACTLVLIVPTGQVCITPAARLVFHAPREVSDEGDIGPISEYGKTRMLKLLDLFGASWAGDWILLHNGFGVGLKVMGIDVLAQHYRFCAPDKVGQAQH